MIDKTFETFYLILVEKLKLDELSKEKRMEIIEHIHEFRKEMLEEVEGGYNRGLLEGGYAMSKIRDDYEHRSASP